MRFLVTLVLFSFISSLSAWGQGIEKHEAQKEIERLKKLKVEVQRLLEEKKNLLKKIEEEKKQLEEEKKAFEKKIKEIESERYKKLAQIFEKMDPEMAGQKLSKFSDPKEAAYIIYNMKSRKAGNVLNYVDPEMVNKIVEILTKVKKQKAETKN
ncbi:magnesium transporter MgtE N-terminal domain-containing protein [Desulfurobacterium thermolithotrophum]|uniref:magnesium transporter MgtE N-terminal domain-containing protein n=1 Tax=Desulfurobacterium thermolithotrophum TaxID=64160 RepID=UPI0013D75F1A|nr:hypothetical protein [Desulfurobacterium thermolithotrophum]